MLALQELCDFISSILSNCAAQIIFVLIGTLYLNDALDINFFVAFILAYILYWIFIWVIIIFPRIPILIAMFVAFLIGLFNKDKRL